MNEETFTQICSVLNNEANRLQKENKALAYTLACVLAGVERNLVIVLELLKGDPESRELDLENAAFYIDDILTALVTHAHEHQLRGTIQHNVPADSHYHPTACKCCHRVNRKAFDINGKCLHNQRPNTAAAFTLPNNT